LLSFCLSCTQNRFFSYMRKLISLEVAQVTLLPLAKR
jgi:hypothetical protein